MSHYLKWQLLELFIIAIIYQDSSHHQRSPLETVQADLTKRLCQHIDNNNGGLIIFAIATTALQLP